MPSFPTQPSRTALTIAALTCALLPGCGNNNSNSGTTTPTNPSPASPFATTVFIGDSLTAGYQNGSLLDTQQKNGYANLLATQANFAITLPLVAPPGAPAVLELTSTGFPPGIQATSGVTTGRDNPSAQPTDLAVPGHKLHDLLNFAPAVGTGDETIITDLVLGFPVGNTNTQIQEAVALKPSTVFVWIGNDDALQADESGDPGSMTPLASFTSDYTQLMTTLQGTKANLIVANIPDVTTIPYMTPAATLAADLANLAGNAGAAANIEAALGLQNGDLVNATGLQNIQAQLPAISKGGTPTPLPANAVLTAAEAATVQATINSYNQVIQQQASAVGATLVDLHAYVGTFAAGLSINGATATESFLGGLFGLDGIHPTNTGYALLANQFITAINTKFSLTTPAVNVNTVAAADPYFGSNIKPAATAITRIPANAALRSDELIRGFKARKSTP